MPEKFTDLMLTGIVGIASYLVTDYILKSMFVNGADSEILL